MAGHWIPWECGLTKKREVVIIARAMSVNRREAAAMCMEVWEWAQEQSLDGMVHGVAPEDISDALALPGIGEAMVAAGWLVVSDSAVQFPNWDRFNGRPAKARLLSAERKRRYDSRHKVTVAALHR